MEEESKHRPRSHRSACTISKNHLMYLGELECNISFETIQKTALAVGKSSYPQKNFVLIGICVL